MLFLREEKRPWPDNGAQTSTNFLPRTSTAGIRLDGVFNGLLRSSAATRRTVLRLIRLGFFFSIFFFRAPDDDRVKINLRRSGSTSTPRAS